MEKMRIEIKSIARHSEYIEVRALAMGRHARIRLDVVFRERGDCTPIRLREKARDEVLKYLDIA